MKKAKLHFEASAMAGHEVARFEIQRKRNFITKLLLWQGMKPQGTTLDAWSIPHVKGNEH
jgi:hypothetical protein